MHLEKRGLWTAWDARAEWEVCYKEVFLTPHYCQTFSNATTYTNKRLIVPFFFSLRRLELTIQ